jgi:HTH-type transcriptional regulator, competence development regulator
MRRESKSLGSFLRERREELRASDPAFSLRQVAERIGIQPSYLSQVERDLAPSLPAEDTLVRLAGELEMDSDLLLAMAGKVSTDLREVILARPQLFAELIRDLRMAPDHALVRIVREVRDGDW